MRLKENKLVNLTLSANYKNFALLFISGAGGYSIDERLRKMFAKSHY